MKGFFGVVELDCVKVMVKMCRFGLLYWKLSFIKSVEMWVFMLVFYFCCLEVVIMINLVVCGVFVVIVMVREVRFLEVVNEVL